MEASSGLRTTEVTSQHASTPLHGGSRSWVSPKEGGRLTAPRFESLVTKVLRPVGGARSQINESREEIGVRMWLRRRPYLKDMPYCETCS